MATKETGKSEALRRKMLPRIIKVCLKVLVILIFYILLSSFLNPFKNFLGDFNVMIDMFFIVFILFVILGELASGSIFQHFFNVAKNLFMLFYFAHFFEKGTFTLTMENVYVTIDLRTILSALIMINLLILAKSMLNTINFLSKNEEQVETQNKFF